MFKSIKRGFVLSYIHLLYAYMICVAFAGVAIPVGSEYLKLESKYLKLDWIGALIICAEGTARILTGGRINKAVKIYVAVFILWMVINSSVAVLMAQGQYNVQGFLSYFLQFMLALLTFLMLSSMSIRTETTQKLMVFWVLIACTASLLAIVQVLVGDIIIDKFLYIPYYDESKISKKIIAGVLAPTAWFAEASWFGSFLVVPTMFVICEVIRVRDSSKNRKFFLVAAFIILAGLFLSYSITASLSVFIGILAISIWSPRARLPILLIILIGATLVFAFSDSARVALQISRFSELFKNLADFSPGSKYYGTTTSFYVRSVGFYEGLSAFVENPIAGIGIGQGERPFNSGFITLLVEQGIFGAFLYFVPIILIIPRLERIRRHGESDLRHLATFFIVALVADYANGLVTHNSFHLQRWLLISIVFGWLHSLRRKPHFEGPDSKHELARVVHQFANGSGPGSWRSGRS